MELAKITTKGQVTIPSAIRKKLGVGEGDKIVFIAKDNGYMIFSEKDMENGRVI